MFDVELRFYVSFMVRFLGYYPSILILQKSSHKRFKLYAKILTLKSIISPLVFFASNLRRVKTLSNLKLRMSLLSFIESHMFAEFYRFRSINAKINVAREYNITIFPFFMAQIFCDYIAEQIDLSHQLKDFNFKTNILVGITTFASFLLTQHNLSYISGLKIICLGK
jgi:hypothetical protein